VAFIYAPLKERQMKCPHCTVTIHPGWTPNTVIINQQQTAWRLHGMICPACVKEIFVLHKFQQPNGTGAHLYSSQVYPTGSNRGPVSKDVPPSIAQDYEEAALVLSLSPKASAALSRRCLQAILQQAGYTQRDLAKQIDAVLAETDARKALPTGPHNMLDAIRNFGNFSAHPITDQTTLQVIDVQDHEAEYCLDILDSLFDHYYVRVEEAKRRRAALDATLAAAGKPPSK
jgi:hypothetical protein